MGAFGLTDWDSLITVSTATMKTGAYDIRGPQPCATGLASLLADLASGRSPAQPVSDSRGWWRRQGRLWVVPHPDPYPHGFPPVPTAMRDCARVGRRPILIAGGKGTLATAFARICAARGLGYELLLRSELDIADEMSVAAVFERLRPWAVINAAGYVRVDEAELDQDRCRRENTTGAQLLAEASSRRGMRLLCFSSDLVFNGRSRRPYREGDSVAPLSAYGRSKADAETLVQAACPHALIARTSAFFGPWDQANAVHHAVTAFAAGRRWRAASDQRVSPTYVPDLVNVSLDLLIDGADGVWHLSNDGDVSWSELAGKAASALGYSNDLVEECLSEELGLAAARPAYSVLGTNRGQRLPELEDALARFVADEIVTFAGRLEALRLKEIRRPSR